MPYFRRANWWFAGGAIAIGAVGLMTFISSNLHSSANTAANHKSEIDSASTSAATRVETILATKGGLAQVASEPGSAHSFESAELYAKVSGYVEKLYVDIGSRVKRGDLLAEIDVPELTKDVESAAASYQQALAEVAQAQARIESAIADQKATEAKITQSKADVDRWKAEVAYSESQYERNRELFDLKAMPERVVEEKVRQFESAKASYRAAESNVTAAEQQAVAASARISLAKADLKVYEAKAQVSESQLEKSKLMASYTKITSPYDGVITARNFHRGDFVRAPGQGGQAALLAVDRTDKMRVVVKIPDLEVPYVQPGDKAIVRFAALGQREFIGEVARIADSEDPLTRTMQVEIDLANLDGAIRDRMYGQVEIALEEAPPGVTIPTTCLVGDVTKGRGKVFVVDGSQARLREVLIGKDNGIEIEVLTGINPAETVILHPPADLADGSKVVTTPAVARLTSKPSH